MRKKERDTKCPQSNPLLIDERHIRASKPTFNLFSMKEEFACTTSFYHCVCDCDDDCDYDYECIYDEKKTERHVLHRMNDIIAVIFISIAH